MIVVAASSCILFMALWGTAGVGHRSRSGWRREVVGVRGCDFLGDYRYIGWGRSIFFPGT
jgi:hypothetical protein